MEQRFHNKLGYEYELFKLASPHYDELENSVGDLIKETFSNSNLSEINTLEIGFGAGATTIVILNSDKKVRLTAIDNESTMLPKVTEKLVHVNPERYKLIIEDGLSFLMKSSDNSYDVVASAWVLHNFTTDYRNKVLGEIYRVLKPGGVFINADKIETTDRVQHAKNMEWQLAQFDVFDRIGRPELKVEWTKHYLEDSAPNRAL